MIKIAQYKFITEENLKTFKLNLISSDVFFLLIRMLKFIIFARFIVHPVYFFYTFSKYILPRPRPEAFIKVTKKLKTTRMLLIINIK